VSERLKAEALLGVIGGDDLVSFGLWEDGRPGGPLYGEKKYKAKACYLSF
jgi:hypothetical protein